MQKMLNQRVKSFPIEGTSSAGCHTRAEVAAKPCAYALFLRKCIYEVKGKSIESGRELRGNRTGRQEAFKMFVYNKDRDRGETPFLESSCCQVTIYRSNHYRDRTV